MINNEDPSVSSCYLPFTNYFPFSFFFFPFSFLYEEVILSGSPQCFHGGGGFGQWEFSNCIIGSEATRCPDFITIGKICYGIISKVEH